MTPRRAPRIAALILAAGEGRRFGAIKQLATFHGQPLLSRAVDAARGAGADPVFLVLGAHREAIEAALHRDARIVANDDWRSGVASSLRAGISAILESGDDVDGVMILSIDQPLVDATALHALVAVFDAAHSIVASEYAGTIGVPVVIARERLGELASSVAGDRGAGAWLRARSEAVTTIPMPAAEHDADTVDVLRALEERGAT